MARCKWSLPIMAWAIVLPSWSVSAADGPARPEASVEQQKPSAEHVAQLIKQLDADDYDQRQAASEKLALLGRPVIPALSKAAGGESLEAAVRAIEILKKFYESSDEAAKKEAKAALEQIVKSDKTSVARRAQEVIQPSQPAQAAPGGGIILGGGALGGMIQVQAQVVAGVGQTKKLSVKTVNGVKEIEAEEGSKKVRITEDPQNGIKMEITAEKDGKPKTEKFEAKSREELQKKHPEAYKTYKEYAENQGGAIGAFQIQVNAGGNAVPVPIQPGIQVVPQPAPGNAMGQPELVNKLLESFAKRLDRFSKDEMWRNASPQAKEELKKNISELRQRLGDLEKQLQTPAEKPAQNP